MYYPDDLALAPYHYAFEGVPLEIYFDNLRAGHGPRRWGVEANRGRHLSRKWEWTYPDDGATSEVNLKIKCLDPDYFVDGQLGVLSDAQTTVRAVPKWAGKTIQHLTVGDSTSHNGLRHKRLMELANQPGLKIQLQGTVPTIVGGYPAEGRSGWRAFDFLTYPQIGAMPNAFVTHGFDAGQYVDTHGAPDSITWHLGINDMAQALNTDSPYLEGHLSSFITQMRQMIGLEIEPGVTGWKAAADPAHLIALPYVPAASQDAFGRNYRSGLERDQHHSNMVQLSHRIIEEFGGMESEKIFLLPFNSVIDTVNGFPRSESPLHGFTEATSFDMDNGVHPGSAGGNDQAAAQEYACLNYLAWKGII